VERLDANPARRKVLAHERTKLDVVFDQEHRTAQIEYRRSNLAIPVRLVTVCDS
jgi:hypothetical protein